MRGRTACFADRETGAEADDNVFGLWPAFLRIRAGLGWAQVVIYAAFGLAFMLAMAWLLGRDFPPGVLQSYFDLPWPFS